MTMEMKKILRSFVHNGEVYHISPENQSDLDVLIMEYQNIHQRVEQHSSAGTQNTLQVLVVIASVLAFSVSFYQDPSYEMFVNVAMFLIFPIVALSLICSILSINIKICSYGEYLITIEKRINYILRYSNSPTAKADEKIVDWERWRKNYGVANDGLVFYDEVLLYAPVFLGAFILPLIRLNYLGRILSQHFRLWTVVIPALFSLFLTSIITLLRKFNAHLSMNNALLNTSEITYGDSLLDNEEKHHTFSLEGVRFMVLFIGIYCFLFTALLMSVSLPLYNADSEADFLVNQIITHRGLHDNTNPENTLSAFSNSIHHNYIIELDIRFSKDGVPVVIHDKELSRLCNVDSNVTDLTVDKIKKLSVLGVEAIPTLQEALDFINGQVPVIVDIKDYFIPKKNIEAVADILKNFQGDIAVQSFGPLTLSWFKKNYPNIPRGQIFGDWGAFSSKPVFRLRDNFFNFISQPDFVNYDRNVIKYASLDQAISHGVPIIGWMFDINEINHLTGTDSVYSGFIIANSKG